MATHPPMAKGDMTGIVIDKQRELTVLSLMDCSSATFLSRASRSCCRRTASEAHCPLAVRIYSRGEVHDWHISSALLVQLRRRREIKASEQSGTKCTFEFSSCPHGPISGCCISSASSARLAACDPPVPSAHACSEYRHTRHRLSPAASAPAPKAR